MIDTETNSADRTTAADLRSTRFVALMRALYYSAGQAALRKSLPSYLTMVVVATMIFEGNGLQPATLVDKAQGSLAARFFFWSVWLLFTMPAARAVLATTSASWLRSLPIPRWHFLVIQGAFMTIVELPWLLLWLRGGGMVHGLGVLATAVSAHCLLVGRSLRPINVGLTIVTSLVILLPAPPWLMLASMSLVSIVALRLAWIDGRANASNSDMKRVC